MLRFCTCFLLLGLLLLGAAPARPDEPQFARDVKPILIAHCCKCHGLEARQAGLDLRTRRLLLRGGDQGPALDLNNGKMSLIYRQVVSRNMPPDGELDLTTAQIEAIRRWVEAGAPPQQTNAPESDRDVSLVSDRDRQFWAFQKLRRVGFPPIDDTDRLATSIDRFVSARLAKVGLRLAPPADPATLIRRAQLDLVGLPPEPTEIERFVGDRSPDAYQRLLDRLLASPHFGERWGRHWMDAVGYSEIRGTDFDAALNRNGDYMSGMWRYRQYVIESHNRDKPFTRFITEQLAGDELLDWRNADPHSERVNELLVATSFLRMAVDLTWDPPDNSAFTRFRVLHQTVATVAGNLLGLSLKCARCHSHKFDPVPQRDYYRMLALFTPAYNPQTWVLPADRDLTRGNVKIHAVYDVGPPPETYLLRRGDHTQPGRAVQPGFLSVLCDDEQQATQLTLEPNGATSGHRLALARWLTDSEGRAAALMSRVQVNRAWQHLFGVGLVSSSDNFGHQGARPTHPNLLESLATEWVNTGWRLKPLLRRLMGSAVYRQASTDAPSGRDRHPAAVADAPLARMPVRRLPSEIIRDAMLACSGQMDRQIGGPSINTEAQPDGSVRITSDNQPTPGSRWRRSVYLLARRRWFPTVLGVFDQPNMGDHCTRRESSTIVLQALTMLNDQFVMERADDFSRRVFHEAGPATEERIGLAFAIALGRAPSARELESCRQLIARQTDRFQAAGAAQVDQKALACLCHVLFNTSEFLYVE